MAVTGVTTNLSEYSRYHRGTTPDRSDLSVIVTTITVDSPTPGDTLTVSLFRLDGYGVVCTKLIILTTATTYTVNFDLNIDGVVPYTYGLAALGSFPAASTSDNIYRCKQGDYTIQVTDNQTQIVTDSYQFAVSIVPVWEVQNVWAKGVTFWDFEVLKPRVQPQVITGVTVTEVSENHYRGPFTLTLTIGSTLTTLAWGTIDQTGTLANGPAVPITGTGSQQLLLLNSTNDFIMVEVVPLQLPKISTAETLYIDSGRMTPTALIDAVRRATSYVQKEVVCKVEPSIVDTDPSLNGFADEQAPAETYYRPTFYNKWMNFKLPYPRILWPGDLSVTGCFGFTQTAQVPRAWLSWSEMTGIVELVPSSNAQVIWSFYNSIFVMAYLFNYPSIPGFWHYRCTVGLRDLWNERAIIRECIAKKAVLELLATQGTAYRSGVSSRSTGRDGVSQGDSYSGGSEGVFSGQIGPYRLFLEKELPKARKRFCGIQFIRI